MTPIDIIISLILTYAIGLSIPLLLRFVFLRRPIKKSTALIIVFVIAFIHLYLLAGLSSELGKNRIVGIPALIIIAFLSYYILRKDHTQEDTAEPVKAPIEAPKVKREKVFRGDIALLVIGGSIFIFFLIYIFIPTTPKNYDDCIKEYTKNTQSQLATRALVLACRRTASGDTTQVEFDECIFENMPEVMNDLSARELHRFCEKEYEEFLESLSTEELIERIEKEQAQKLKR